MSVGLRLGARLSNLVAIPCAPREKHYGLRSELGRDDNLIGYKGLGGSTTGTSIFCPARLPRLCKRHQHQPRTPPTSTSLRCLLLCPGLHLPSVTYISSTRS